MITNEFELGNNKVTVERGVDRGGFNVIDVTFGKERYVVMSPPGHEAPNIYYESLLSVLNGNSIDLKKLPSIS